MPRPSIERPRGPCSSACVWDPSAFVGSRILPRPGPVPWQSVRLCATGTARPLPPSPCPQTVGLLPPTSAHEAAGTRGRPPHGSTNRAATHHAHHESPRRRTHPRWWWVGCPTCCRAARGQGSLRASRSRPSVLLIISKFRNVVPFVPYTGVFRHTRSEHQSAPVGPCRCPMSCGWLCKGAHVTLAETPACLLTGHSLPPAKHVHAPLGCRPQAHTSNTPSSPQKARPAQSPPVPGRLCRRPLRCLWWSSTNPPLPRRVTIHQRRAAHFLP